MLWVLVLRSEGGRAIDDFGLRSPDNLAPEEMPPRAIAGRTADATWIRLPIPQLASVLVVGRDRGPEFLRTEVANAESVITLAIKTLVAALRDGAGAGELTAGLAAAAGRRTA